MKLTRQTNFANTAIVGNVTYRMVGTYGVAIVCGIAIFQSPVFKWNLPAMIAYIALASIIVGQTPTHRTILANFYGLLLKKPVRMVISDQATLNTMGHGVREIIFDNDLDAPAFKMGNQYVLVYNVTSDLTQWSNDDDYRQQALHVKNLFNTFEGFESLQIVTKTDSDTGMLQLEDALKEQEQIGPNDDDFRKLANQRRTLLHRVATQDVGRSVQQYAVLRIKPKNVNRCTKALRRSARVIRPATNPGDIILSAMGLEAGADQDDAKFTKLVPTEAELHHDKAKKAKRKSKMLKPHVKTDSIPQIRIGKRKN